MADLTEAQKQSYWWYTVTLSTILLIIRNRLSSINSLFRLTTISETKEEQR